MPKKKSGSLMELSKLIKKIKSGDITDPEVKKELKKQIKSIIFKKVILPNLPWILIGLLAFLGIIIIVGKILTLAEDDHRGLNVSDADHNKYVLMEAATYTPMSASDHSYKDEYEYRLSWAALEELDSYFFDGKDKYYIDENGNLITEPDKYTGTKTEVKKSDFINEAKAALGPKYLSDDPNAKDIYWTYTWEIVDYETVSGTDSLTGEPYSYQIPIYGWKGRSKEIKRHLIYTAKNWSGTFTRAYNQVWYKEKPPANPSPGDTYHENYIWEFQTTSSKYDFEAFKTFVKSKESKIWDSEINLMLEAIRTILGVDSPFDGDSISEIDQFINYDASLIFGEGEFLWPTKSTKITSQFGSRMLNGQPDDHKGMDIAPLSPGDPDPVFAARDGEVVHKGWYGGGGNTVIIDHGLDASTPPKRVVTKYMHFSRFADNIAVGTKVTKGQIIGYMGNTGNSFGVHLHYAIFIDDVPVNPMNYYAPIGSQDVEAYISAIPSHTAEMDLFIRLVNSEGGGTGDKGIMAVAEVVLNRLRSPVFKYSPRSLYSVIYAPSQFEVVAIGTINNKPDTAQYERISALIKRVIQERTNYARGATFFCSYPAGSPAETAYMNSNKLQFTGVDYGNRFYVSISR